MNGKTLFLLTVDTEEEWNWNGELPKPPFSTQNIKHIPELQNLCAEFGVRPTYFVNHAVVDVALNVDILKKYFVSGECDIGAHLHPWSNPPVREQINDKYSHAINLDNSLVREKLEILTSRLQKEFGTHPFSFRAGRWGMNADHIKILASLGYRVDSSVQPYLSDTYFSYAKAKTSPCRPSFQDLLTEDDNQTQILEVPASRGFTRPQFEILQKIHELCSVPPLRWFRLIGIMWQLKIMRKVAITAEDTDSSDVCKCIDAHISRGDTVINMYIHSSDLLPGGGTPYVTNETDKSQFMTNLRECLQYIQNHPQIECVVMRELPDKLGIKFS